MRRRTFPAALVVMVLLLVFAATAHAARVSELTESTATERAIRFFSFQDPSLRYALGGSILLGISCGMMGVFLVVRRLSLMSDALSHAVLPGVAFGYLWNMTRDPVAIFIGATLCGLLGAGLVQAIRSTTRQKEDAALGFVLSAFFATGVCLMTMIQNMPGGNKGGLDKFMFGQAAALGPTDLILLAVVTFLVVGMIFVFYKEMTVTSFDNAFARTVGIRPQVFHYLLMLLLAFAVVSALQAVGVVLVSAMLVIPACAAFVLSDRLGPMLLLAACFGMTTGSTGAFFSYVGRDLPTGPLMVLSASTVFTAALFFAPRHGILAKILRHANRSRRIKRENALKAIYRVLEDGDFRTEHISLNDYANSRRQPPGESRRSLGALSRKGLVVLAPNDDTFSLTPAGWRRACEIVRNHRLWELYLTRAAHFAVDHVHEDAEQIEHMLGEDTVHKLESFLNHARRDPHGRLIPGREDIEGGISRTKPTAA
ncbi:metal ABC transporter permease [Candidatus Sumerlaeota bacterium]|nr:metal ABC transporter permease [Candidatus Sumerlaeota bacterium]